MFVLHLDLPVKEAMEHELEREFTEVFRPAISLQPGFRAVELLQSLDDKTLYCLTIAFENRDLQQKWVATDLHEKVWSALQKPCKSYSLRTFNSI